MSNLRSLSTSELKAEKGFRAVAFIDSEPYQIGQDVPDIDTALTLCQIYSGGYFQVYDSNGMAQCQKS